MNNYLKAGLLNIFNNIGLSLFTLRTLQHLYFFLHIVLVLIISKNTLYIIHKSKWCYFIHLIVLHKQLLNGINFFMCITGNVINWKNA